ncbi:ankyrin repeat domain-containing protein [Curvibacter sp. APW13]|uniref:ankyrin repeat domain-containing protein n=1 Tax=Curvibacter sp. APW13 TaxID=3077236 RepID=UPI0028DFACD9|nr:ankyrin repeat domain-containing protein [Curvibacter sp. APW13]MDT8991642.1 ankyrin repeat domain-containing protein [Curvibacter sp. APW13]
MKRRYFSAGLLSLLPFIGSIATAGSYDDFFIALRQDNDLAVANLLERGFDPNTIDPAGQSGLFLALKIRSVRSALVLAKAPATVIDARNAQDESPLMLAALRGYVDICRLLIEREADVNKPGWTPLHYAATGGHAAVVRLLLDEHAYIDAESPNGSTPLMMAAMYGTLEVVQLLVLAGADVTLKNELGLSALDFATRAGKPDTVAYLETFLRQARTGGTW